MSFYSNNLGKNTALNGFNKTNKENLILSPALINGTNEGFNKKQQIFQNSANGFMRPDEDPNSLTVNEDEQMQR